MATQARGYRNPSLFPGTVRVPRDVFFALATEIGMSLEDQRSVATVLSSFTKVQFSKDKQTWVDTLPETEPGLPETANANDIIIFTQALSSPRNYENDSAVLGEIAQWDGTTWKDRGDILSNFTGVTDLGEDVRIVADALPDPPIDVTIIASARFRIPFPLAANESNGILTLCQKGDIFQPDPNVATRWKRIGNLLTGFASISALGDISTLGEVPVDITAYGQYRFVVGNQTFRALDFEEEQTSLFRAEFSTDGLNTTGDAASEWHYPPTANDDWIRYSQDGGMSWTLALPIREDAEIPKPRYEFADYKPSTYRYSLAARNAGGTDPLAVLYIASETPPSVAGVDEIVGTGWTEAVPDTGRIWYIVAYNDGSDYFFNQSSATERMEGEDISIWVEFGGAGVPAEGTVTPSAPWVAIDQAQSSDRVFFTVRTAFEPVVDWHATEQEGDTHRRLTIGGVSSDPLGLGLTLEGIDHKITAFLDTLIADPPQSLTVDTTRRNYSITRPLSSTQAVTEQLANGANLFQHNFTADETIEIVGGESFAFRFLVSHHVSETRGGDPELTLRFVAGNHVETKVIAVDTFFELVEFMIPGGERNVFNVTITGSVRVGGRRAVGYTQIHEGTISRIGSHEMELRELIQEVVDKEKQARIAADAQEQTARVAKDADLERRLGRVENNENLPEPLEELARGAAWRRDVDLDVVNTDLVQETAFQFLASTLPLQQGSYPVVNEVGQLPSGRVFNCLRNASNSRLGECILQIDMGAEYDGALIVGTQFNIEAAETLPVDAFYRSRGTDPFDGLTLLAMRETSEDDEIYWRQLINLNLQNSKYVPGWQKLLRAGTTRQITRTATDYLFGDTGGTRLRANDVQNATEHLNFRVNSGNTGTWNMHVELYENDQLQSTNVFHITLPTDRSVDSDIGTFQIPIADRLFTLHVDVDFERLVSGSNAGDTLDVALSIEGHEIVYTDVVVYITQQRHVTQTLSTTDAYALTDFEINDVVSNPQLDAGTHFYNMISAIFKDSSGNAIMRTVIQDAATDATGIWKFDDVNLFPWERLNKQIFALGHSDVNPLNVIGFVLKNGVSPPTSDALEGFLANMPPMHDVYGQLEQSRENEVDFETVTNFKKGLRFQGKPVLTEALKGYQVVRPVGSRGADGNRYDITGERVYVSLNAGNYECSFFPGDVPETGNLDRFDGRGGENNRGIRVSRVAGHDNRFDITTHPDAEGTTVISTIRQID